MSLRSIGTSGVDGPGGTTLLGLGLLAVNAYGIFSWPWIAGPALAYGVLCILLWTVPVLRPANDRLWTIAGHCVLALSLVAALVLSVLVGGMVWVPFKVGGGIVVGLFGLAVLCFLAGGALSSFASLFHPLLVGVLAVALHQLPAPPGSPETRPPDPVQTTLIVHVEDGDGRRLGNVAVHVQWKAEGEPDQDSAWYYVGTTRWENAGATNPNNAQGTVEHETYQDPTGKVAVVKAASPAGAYATGRYEPVRVELRGIRPGETREVTAVTPYRPFPKDPY
jgi:hypothetical protein